jgi:hypothetical protein
MRIRITFLAGFAAGFIVGTRVGRERYEQMKQMGKKAAEHPAVRQATRVAGSAAAGLAKTAGQKAAERMPDITETAKSSAARVRGQLDRRPGRRSGDDEPSAVNGTRPRELADPGASRGTRAGPARGSGGAAWRASSTRSA